MAVSAATASLPPEAAHAVEESAGAGFAVASQLGSGGQQLADAVRDAFAAGLGDALTAGAAIAILTAAFTLWRAPRRSTSEVLADASEVPAESPSGSSHRDSPDYIGVR